MGVQALRGLALVFCDRRALVGLPFVQADHLRPKSCIRRKDSVIAIANPMRRCRLWRGGGYTDHDLVGSPPNSRLLLTGTGSPARARRSHPPL